MKKLNVNKKSNQWAPERPLYWFSLRTYRHICMRVNLHICVNICIHTYHILNACVYLVIYIYEHIYVYHIQIWSLRIVKMTESQASESSSQISNSLKSIFIFFSKFSFRQEFCIICTYKLPLLRIRDSFLF